MPIGILIFPGTGIQDNLADKARKLGILVHIGRHRRVRMSAAVSTVGHRLSPQSTTPASLR